MGKMRLPFIDSYLSYRDASSLAKASEDDLMNVIPETRHAH